MSGNNARAEVSIEPGEKASILGRNGMFSPVAVTIWEGGGAACIDGIGKRGMIRGGLELPLHRMDELAMKWLQSRGLVMPAADGKKD